MFDFQPVNVPLKYEFVNTRISGDILVTGRGDEVRGRKRELRWRRTNGFRRSRENEIEDERGGEKEEEDAEA